MIRTVLVAIAAVFTWGALVGCSPASDDPRPTRRSARQPTCGRRSTRRTPTRPSARSKTLLEAGADPNITDSEGRTSRELAVEHGHDEIVAVIDAAG